MARSVFSRAMPAATCSSAVLSVLLVSSGGCGKKPPAAAPAPSAVTVVTVTPKDEPVSAEFVGQTQSSHLVNIQARVSGFLDKRMYTEGAVVKEGQVLFQMDPKPFQAQLSQARAALACSTAAAADWNWPVASSRSFCDRAFNAVSGRVRSRFSRAVSLAASAWARAARTCESWAWNGFGSIWKRTCPSLTTAPSGYIRLSRKPLTRA